MKEPIWLIEESVIEMTLAFASGKLKQIWRFLGIRGGRPDLPETTSAKEDMNPDMRE